MEFDESKIYSAKDADKLKIGSMVITADTYGDLKQCVLNNEKPEKLLEVLDEYTLYRFRVYNGHASNKYALAYLVSKPAKLKWTDLKLGDIICCGAMTAMVTAIDSDDNDDDCHIFAGDIWLDDDELKDWEKVNEHK